MEWVVAQLIEVEQGLLLGLPRAVVIACAVVVERALKEKLGADAGNAKMLGELLRAAHDKGVVDKDDMVRLNALNKLRIDAAHSKGGKDDAAGITLERAEAGVDDVVGLLERWGLCSPAVVAEARKKAQALVREAPPDPFHHLDRGAQKQRFTAALDGAPPLLIFVADGERDQGQEHFTGFAGWKLRRELQGTWRHIDVEWPGRGLPVGNRFVELLERLYVDVGLDVRALPVDDDPAVGGAAWDDAIDALPQKLGKARRALLLRHRLQFPDDDDRALLDLYLARVWSRVASALVDPVALSFELVRTPKGGVPFVGAAWRAGAKQRQVAALVEKSLSRHLSASQAASLVLPELTSVPAIDVAAWLSRHRGFSDDDARREAARILELSGGGRFSLVVEALSLVRGQKR